MRILLPLTAVMVCGAFWLLAGRDKPQPAKAPPPPIVSPVAAAKTAPQPVQAVPEEAAEVAERQPEMGAWRQIEQLHSSRHSGDPKWVAQATADLEEHFSLVNYALDSDRLYKRFQARVRSVDCRDGSCVVEAEFATYAEGVAYLELFQTGRISREFGVGDDYECPLRSAAVPRIPGAIQPNMPILMHFDCVPGETVVF